MSWLWTVFVAFPAGILGGLGDMGLDLALLLATLGCAIGVGALVERIMDMRVTPAVRHSLAVALGIAAFFYVGLVLWEARHVLVTTLINEERQSQHFDDEDDD